jgi:tetratricopeptide (TPR) repeat protein
LLTKFSALLAVPFVVAAVAVLEFVSMESLRESGDAPTSEAKPKSKSYRARNVILRLWRIGILLAGMLAVCGWHYARVWHRFGKPLVGNWDSVLARSWWQDPGYRTAGWYERFGETFKRPLFSAFSSFLDGVYSSLWGDGLCSGSGDINVRAPWNYDLMNLGFLFGAVGTVLLVVGCVVVVFRKIRGGGREGVLLLGFLLTTAFGMIFMTLRVPSYAQGKAFYALPALLAFSTVAALGWEFLASRGRWVRPVLQFLLVAWAVTVYSAFWIQRTASATALARGYGLASQGSYAEAVDAFSQALQRNPNSVRGQVGLADGLDRSGRREEGRRQAAATLQRWANDPEAQVQAANSLEADGRFREAAELFRQALETVPDRATAYESLARCLLQMKQYEPAKAACQEGLGVNPFSPELHYFLAAAMAETGDMTNAAVHLQFVRELKRQPQLPQSQSR